MKRKQGHGASAWIVLGSAALVMVTSAVSFREQTFGMQTAGGPAVFRPVPGREVRATSLPRGVILLVQFLQQLADSTEKKVCCAAEEAPDATIELPHAVKRLDVSTAATILRSGGYELSETKYKGSDVHWVQRLLSTKRQKGRIIRKSNSGDPEEAPVFKSPAGPRGPGKSPPGQAAVARGQGTLNLYVRDEGSGARYVIIFQTDSRDEADEAVSLLQAHQRSKTGATKER